jgi:multicomponent Na+:H+ antiporter subunit C
MLTDVVVEATVVALLLAMVVKVHEKAGTLSPDDLKMMRG